ncbi:MAG: hypothetical protein II992_00265 [Lachnospiraceae bacterium]|nr:hypothetical protein [Lachnospiraceae bacterium]
MCCKMVAVKEMENPKAKSKQDVLTPVERKALMEKNQYKKCTCCRKMVYIPGMQSEYAYKRKRGSRKIYYCSWACFRNDDRRKRYGK